MKQLITIAGLIVLTATSATAVAGGYQWKDDSKTISGATVSSKQAAYEIGIDMIENYQNMSSAQLRDQFFHKFDYVDHRSFSITDSHVMVDEFLRDDGQVVYQPVLNVEYKYRKRDIGNNR